MTEDDRDKMAALFGENLRAARMRGGLSQEQAAFGAGLHRTEIGLLERGERLPRIDTAVKLAGSLSVTPAELLAGMEWERPTSTDGKLKLTQEAK